MDRLLSCECGREHFVSRSQAGQELQCDCGKVIDVPTLRRLADLPLAESPASSAQKSATGGVSRGMESTPSRSWQGWRGPVMALATAGFLIATVACGWYGWQRFTIDTSYTVEKEIKGGENMFDSFDAGTLSTVWHEMGTMGLQTKDPPNFFLWQIYAKDREQRTLISGGIAAVFGLIALAVAFTARRR